MLQIKIIIFLMALYFGAYSFGVFNECKNMEVKSDFAHIAEQANTSAKYKDMAGSLDNLVPYMQIMSYVAIVMAVVGCICALLHNYMALMIYAFVILLVIIAHIIVIICFGIGHSNFEAKESHLTWYIFNTTQNSSIDYMHSQFECCGYVNFTEEYKGGKVPLSCCTLFSELKFIDKDAECKNIQQLSGCKVAVPRFFRSKLYMTLKILITGLFVEFAAFICCALYAYHCVPRNK